LKLEDEATLEFSKYEYKTGGQEQLAESSQPQAASSSQEGTSAGVNPSEKSTSGQPPNGVSHAAPPKKRFSAFHFRKRNPSRTSPTVTAGPSLQVVDAEATPAADAQASSLKKEGSKEEDGVRVTIRLEALTENEQSMASINTQITYLHIVRMGQRSAAETEKDEDARPWVVKVVKREATIGPHTFHLHEIYGLTTASSAPAVSHSYPPNADQQQQQAYDFAGQECVLCLSSPREVVLLPCRHLVACKECAVNMVEFGAGGTLQQPGATEPAATPTVTVPPAAPIAADETQQQDEGDTPGNEVPARAAAGAEASAGTAQVNGAPTTAAVPTLPPPIPAPRRKRKPKGWFCPVCRQPYTSLLRITTTPPDIKAVRHSEDDAADPMPESMAAVVADNPAPVSFLRTISRASIRALSGTGAPANPPASVAEVPVVTA